MWGLQNDNQQMLKPQLEPTEAQLNMPSDAAMQHLTGIQTSLAHGNSLDYKQPVTTLTEYTSPALTQ